MSTHSTRKDMAEAARDVCQRQVAPLAEETDRLCRYPRRQLGALGEAGLLGLTIAQEHGGKGWGFREVAEVAEEVGAACASTGAVYVMHLCAVAAVKTEPTQARVDRVLRPSAAGRHVSTLAFSERGSGGHFYAPVSRPRREDAAFLLDAEKSFVTSAGEADSYVVSSLSSEPKGPMDSNVYIVERGAGGLSVQTPWEGLGLRGNASAPMSLKGVRIPAGDLIGKEGDGLGLMMQVIMPIFQVGLSAVYIGIARAALSAAITHARARTYAHAGGAAIAGLPAVQASIGEASTALDAARELLRGLAAALDAGSQDALVPLLEAKVASTDAAQLVVARAMKICGGAGFAKRSPVERHFRDAQAGSVMAPTNDVLKELIGKALLGLPLF
jgi:alkylation response protein AidB-like acyl-CoA dehydrogenase